MNKKILAKIGIGYLIFNIGTILGTIIGYNEGKNTKANEGMPKNAKVGDIIVYKDGITEDLEDTYSAAFAPNENYEKLVRAAAQCGKVKNAIVDIVYKDLDEKSNAVS